MDPDTTCLNDSTQPEKQRHGRILHILVTCCLEPTRTKILEKVAENILECGIPLNDLIVIDNASTDPRARTIISRFKNVYVCDKNYGFWSAVNWVLRSHEEILGRTYDFVYVIESDMMHYDYPAIVNAERMLDLYFDIGSVRLQEFSVSEASLYDKLIPQPSSRRWAWVRLMNYFTYERAYFERVPEFFHPTPQHKHMYKTNLAPQVPALNRMSFMKRAFELLQEKKNIAERDFQEIYFTHFPYKQTGLLDGGIFNTKEAFEMNAVAGSFSEAKELAEIGYKLTRFDQMTHPDTMSVNPLCASEHDPVRIVV